jgi:hypothetical protein
MLIVGEVGAVETEALPTVDEALNIRCPWPRVALVEVVEGIEVDEAV